MTDQVPTRSSILFALGELTAESKAHGEAIKSLPEQVANALNPRLVAIEATQASHGQRLTIVERRQWLWMGGGSVVIAVVGYVIHLLPTIMRPS